MEMEAFQIFANNIVSVVVLGWFMFRMESIVKNNTRALNEVNNTIFKCKK